MAIANTYYYARLIASEKPDDRKRMANVALVWPNQKSFGTHLNVSGAGVLRNAPHKEPRFVFSSISPAIPRSRISPAAITSGQRWASAPLNNRYLDAMGKFKADTINVGTLGKNQPLAQKIFDRAAIVDRARCPAPASCPPAPLKPTHESDAPAAAPQHAVGGRQFDAEQLFAGAKEIVIRHAGECYRLRRTSKGKLILTK